MISCTSWVPRGVADPNPRRFEFSQPELDMMRDLEMERKSRSKKGEGEEIDKSDGHESDGDGDGDGRGDGDGDGGDAGETGGATTMKGDNGQNGDLPKELRMDEYSSSSDDDDDDDDDDDGGATAAAKKVGNLLVGLNESEMMAGGCSDEDEEDEDEVDDGGGSDEGNGEDGDDSNDDSDDDDDLDDVEDGREYLPVDVGGMQAMGLGIDETLNFVGGDDDEDDDDSDVEDTNLMADDALLLVAKTDEDFSSLEVHVYEQNSGNLFVHHDIPLPSYPLCLAHGDINHRGEAGNFCAVGMFTPGIEIWNLDVLDALEPACVLGGSGDGDYGTTLPVPAGTGRKGGKKKKKKKAGSGLREGSHTDAVMALSWNAVHRHVIASGSADRTVKVWDVTRAGGADAPATPAATFRHHGDKVQGVAWHPTEGTILATGSFDRTVAIVDARCRDGGGDSPVGKGRLPADCEAIAWDPHRTQCLSAASEDGTVTCWDIRKFGGNGGAGGGGSGGRGGGDDTALWSFVAHEFGGVSDLSYNGHVPGLMATCAIDKTVALWDAHHLSTSETECRGRGRSSSSSSPSPHPCGSKDMGVGKLYSVSFYPSAPWLLGCGGGGNQPALWDLEGVEAIQKRFGERTTGDAKEKEESSVVDFDEIMTGTGGKNANDDDAGVVAAERVREKMEKKTKKKDGGKRRKKKAHRVRRD